jgi:nucleoside-diphosphate-sugar epimerase
VARRIIVTGPSGFVGRHLCQDLARRGYTVIAIARRPDPDLAAMDVTVRPVADLAGATAQELGLRDADTVVHLAGRAHVMGDRARDSSDLYFRNNVETTRVLSEQSTQSGVARFIFLSSVKVFGDGPFVAPLKPSTRPKPADAYGRSKLEAEDWLLGLDRHSAPDVVIVRPPLIYGPGVRANFLQLIRLVERGIPLPFARVNNLRSFVNVGNLCDLMVRLIEERDTARGIYHVADAEDCSTAELIREIAVLMGKPARLFACPEWLLRAGMALIGRSLVYQRLVGSLQLDISGTESMLGWRPPVSRRDGLAQTLSWYFGTKARTGS